VAVFNFNLLLFLKLYVLNLHKESIVRKIWIRKTLKIIAPLNLL